MRPLAREIANLSDTMVGPLAEADPRAAVVQMRLLLELAPGIFDRSDDGSGVLGDAFRTAGAELGRLWARLPDRDPVGLAGELLSLLDADDHGTTDDLLAASDAALGPQGRAELRRLLQARVVDLPKSPGRDDLGKGRDRFIISLRLRALSDLEGDVDAFVAAVELGGRVETVATEIAERLITHRRPSEALSWLDRATSRDEGRQSDLRIAALEALGRQAEAQGLRWTAFEHRLSAVHLRAYLRGLSDFEDVDAEERAIAHAQSCRDRNLALAFLAAWPNLRAANQLVRDHHDELEGRDYLRLRPAAEALAGKHPAAALLRRVLAKDVLRRASSRQYAYAARDVRACAGLASLTSDEPGLETHDAFMRRLRREHPRETGFWSLLEPGAQ